MIRKLIKNKQGITLLELVVAISLFSVVIISATQIFKMVIEGQRNAIASQNIQESMRYAFEAMSKEIRMAQEDVGGPGQCPSVNNGKVYDTSDNEQLYFKNQYDDCVSYYLEDDINGISRLTIDRDLVPAYVTPDDIIVSDLKFSVYDDGDTDVIQSIVTIKMKIKAVGKAMHEQEMTMQTTISSRYYE